MIKSMNPKFKIKKKCRITQGFEDNATSVYKEDGRLGHGAIDYQCGYGTPVFCDNTSFVYKVFKPLQLKSNWVGVYMLVSTDDKDVFYENGIGHFSKVLVEEGTLISENTLVGEEGNSGQVFSGSAGRFITVAEQLAGDKRGAHTHEWYRKVKRTQDRPKYRLRKASGGSYIDEDGYYYEILDFDNGYKGMVDPMQFVDHSDPLQEKKEKLKELSGFLGDLVALLLLIKQRSRLEFLLPAIQDKIKKL